MNPTGSNPLLFLLFSVVMVGWCLLHFAAALRALGHLRHEPQPEIDMDFVRVVDYHAREVREGRSLSTYIASPLRSASKVTKLPLFCQSDCVVEKGARAKAIVATGTLTLEDSVIVAQFADSQGEMTLSAGCFIGGPATSATSVRIGRGVSALSVYAPEITTTTRGTASEKNTSPPAAELLRIPDASPGQPSDATPKACARQISSDTWLFDGDLHATRPLQVTCRLIVTGSLSAPSGSIFENDVKTTGNLILGPECICRGALVADGDIELGAGTTFGRTVYSSGELRLKTGVRGEGSGEVAAYARKLVSMDSDILIRGRVASEGSVISL